MRVHDTPESLKYKSLVHSLLKQGFSWIEVTKKLVNDHGLPLAVANQAVAAVHYELRHSKTEDSN